MWKENILEDEAKIQRLPCSLQNFYKIKILLSAPLENTTKKSTFLFGIKKNIFIKRTNNIHFVIYLKWSHNINFREYKCYSNKFKMPWNILILNLSSDLQKIKDIGQNIELEYTLWDSLLSYMNEEPENNINRQEIKEDKLANLGSLRTKKV